MDMLYYYRDLPLLVASFCVQPLLHTVCIDRRNSIPIECHIALSGRTCAVMGMERQKRAAIAIHPIHSFVRSCCPLPDLFPLILYRGRTTHYQTNRSNE